jgi:hypothetical protein
MSSYATSFRTYESTPTVCPSLTIAFSVRGAAFEPTRRAECRLDRAQSFSRVCAFADGCVMERGAYFPSLHWDTDWNLFPHADGFQLWYLLESHADESEGNMFLARTPELRSDDPPARIVASRSGSVRKTLNKYLYAEPTIKVYDSIDELQLSLEYLAMQPGDCLIFSKRTLHMSDPRPHLRNLDVRRLALNMRASAPPQPPRNDLARRLLTAHATLASRR